MPEYENRTRQGLDAALRELLRQKPLDQLRVRELIEKIGDITDYTRESVI